MVRKICLAEPSKRIFKTGDEMPVEEEHAHAGGGRPGFNRLCYGKIVEA